MLSGVLGHRTRPTPPLGAVWALLYNEGSQAGTALAAQPAPDNFLLFLSWLLVGLLVEVQALSIEEGGRAWGVLTIAKAANQEAGIPLETFLAHGSPRGVRRPYPLSLPR